MSSVITAIALWCAQPLFVGMNQRTVEDIQACRERLISCVKASNARSLSFACVEKEKLVSTK